MSVVSQHKAILKAVKKAGGLTALARKINEHIPPGKKPCLRQTIEFWLKQDKGVTAEWVLALESASGIPRSKFRPDLYPEEK